MDTNGKETVQELGFVDLNILHGRIRIWAEKMPGIGGPGELTNGVLARHKANTIQRRSAFLKHLFLHPRAHNCNVSLVRMA